MTKSIACAVGLFAVVAVAGVARAQTTQPVEWKVSEGGNGHWYQGVVTAPTGASWSDARAIARTRGGDLAKVESASHLQWMFSQIVDQSSLWSQDAGPWVGGWQAPGSVEPGGGWSWVDGTAIGPGIWVGGQPDDARYCGGDNNRMAFWNGGQGGRRPYLEDSPDGQAVTPCVGPRVSAVIEWSADCNADGIVDFGQILRGELADDNHNGIPDVCETSVTGVLPPSVPSQGGVTITINGRNFPDNPTVLVGGTAATNVVRVSATRITATTPAGLPGMTSISVNGFTLPDAFYYRPECGSDLDQNGEVDTADISIILLDFGPCYQAPVAAPTKGPLPPALPDAPTPTSDAPQTR